MVREFGAISGVSDARFEVIDTWWQQIMNPGRVPESMRERGGRAVEAGVNALRCILRLAHVGFAAPLSSAAVCAPGVLLNDCLVFTHCKQHNGCKQAQLHARFRSGQRNSVNFQHAVSLSFQGLDGPRVWLRAGRGERWRGAVRLPAKGAVALPANGRVALPAA